MRITLRQNWWKLLAIVSVLATSLFGQNAQDETATQDPQEQASLRPEVAKRSAAKSPVENSNFVIGNEDVLAISVWKEAELSRVIPVRTDGKISLPLIGELQASGKTPNQLQAEITQGLRSFMSEPEVTVIVQEIKSKRFNILGHVQKPGSYLLNPPTTLVDAIAIAGGFRDFAKIKRIYVLRDDGGKEIRLPFNYKQVIKGSHTDQNIELQPRDTIVVP
ncbi:MAG: polysaccharide biosynthesis/export family protein [Candidatus Sulfotelmatobacter sp.]